MQNKQFLRGLIKKSAEGKYHVIASTATVDRQGEIIDQNGWDLKNFANNPIILYSHDYTEATLPIGRAENVGVTVSGLEMDIVFASPEASPLAQQIKALVDEGILNTLSVGFMVKQRNGEIITQSELLEVSIVKVPANPQAVIQMRSMNGIDEEVKKDIEAAAEEKPAEEAKPETELPEVKGAVADQLDNPTDYYAKWGYLDKCSAVCGAFYDVYMSATTPVEDFGKLLAELAELLAKLAANPTASLDDLTDSVEGEKMLATNKSFVEMLIKRFNEINVKVGAEISAKNTKKLAALKEHLTSGLAVVDDILSSVSQEDSGKAAPAGNSEPVETKSKVAPEAVLRELSVDTLLDFRNSLRISDRHNEKTLSIVNRFLKQKRETAA